MLGEFCRRSGLEECNLHTRLFVVPPEPCTCCFPGSYIQQVVSNLVFFPVRWSLPLTLAADGGQVSGLENISAQASFVVAADCCPK